MSHFAKTVVAVFVGMFVVFLVAATYSEAVGQQMVILESKVLALAQQMQQGLASLPSAAEVQQASVNAMLYSPGPLTIIAPSGGEVYYTRPGNPPISFASNSSTLSKASRVSIFLENVKTGVRTSLLSGPLGRADSRGGYVYYWNPSTTSSLGENSFKILVSLYTSSFSLLGQNESNGTFSIRNASTVPNLKFSITMNKLINTELNSSSSPYTYVIGEISSSSLVGFQYKVNLYSTSIGTRAIGSGYITKAPPSGVGAEGYSYVASKIVGYFAGFPNWTPTRASYPAGSYQITVVVSKDNYLEVHSTPFFQVAY